MTDRRDGPSAEVRIRVMKRDRFTCVYCGTTGAESELEIDHVHPVAKGGSHHVSNLVTACRGCNQKKGAGTLERKVFVSKTFDGPVGLYVHILGEDGLVQFHGQIIGTDGDGLFVEMCSAWTGEFTDVRRFGKDLIYSEKCRLYADHGVWCAHYTRDCRKARDKAAPTSQTPA